ncbi:MAG TPA: ABC transporter permease [Gemmatimonadaceae bacterium]|nr:ABC transporter permease [Gemmatimonadaceae bacterium]
MRLSRQDVRLAVRSFARQPGFTVVAILSLALAIALNTTMYSVLDAMIRPNLDAREPGQLYSVIYWGDIHGHLDDRGRSQLLRSSPVVEADAHVGVENGLASGVEFGEHYAKSSVMQVSPDLFTMLGTRAKRGRLFVTEDETDAARPVIITERFAAALSPDSAFPIGARLLIDGEHRPVIGIIGNNTIPGMRNTGVVSVTTPSPLAGNLIRVRHGISVEQAQQAAAVLSLRFATLAGEAPTGARVQFKQAIKSQFAPQAFHLALAAAVLAVLLVACANLANLQLARGIGRARELAVRAALGASRADIILQLLVESALLALAGLMAGVLLTFWGVHILQSSVPPSIADYVVRPQISWRVFAFAIVVACVTVLLIGLVPAIRVSRVDPNTLLKSSAGTGALKRNRRQYGIMVAAEIALALALLSGASLVARTAVEVRSLDVGYDPRPLSIAMLYMRAPQKDTSIRLLPFTNDVTARLQSLPDLAAVAMWTPAAPEKRAITVDEHGPSPRELPTLLLSYKVVTPNYFRTLGLRVTRGRDFLDGAAAVSEVIIDEHTAHGLFPGADPVGKQIKLGAFETQAPWLRIVGVVPNVDDLDKLIMYRQMPRSSKVGDIYRVATTNDSLVVHARWSYEGVEVLVRTSGSSDRTPVALKRYLIPNGLTRYVETESREEELGIRRERERHDFVASVFITFAVLGVALAALGIYGIVAHSVVERTRELGVRIALGATTQNILYAVLREGNVVALTGVAVGLYLTKDTASWLHAFIFEDDEYSAPLFAAVAVILFVVAVVSALIPALRATRIDPVESLRSE